MLWGAMQSPSPSWRFRLPLGQGTAAGRGRAVMEAMGLSGATPAATSLDTVTVKV